MKEVTITNALFNNIKPYKSDLLRARAQ